MGEFTSGDMPSHDAAKDSQPVMSPGEVETDVADIKADGNKDGLPVFKVGKTEFYQNMSHGRKRVRFKSGTSAAQYMRNTRYNRPFFIEHEGYVRKVK